METALKFLSDRGILLTDEVDYTEYLKNNFANNFFFINHAHMMLMQNTAKLNLCLMKFQMTSK